MGIDYIFDNALCAQNRVYFISLLVLGRIHFNGTYLKTAEVNFNKPIEGCLLLRRRINNARRWFVGFATGR